MEKKSTFNLCSYYILPLLTLNSSSFGGRMNFVNSYIYNDNIVVVINDKEKVGEYWKSPHYVTDYDQEGLTYIVLSIPANFHDTLEKFNKGKYSQFNNKDKALIKKHSGLKYKVPSRKPNKVITAEILLALDLDKDLKASLENQLNVELPDDAELLSIPGKDTYITI